MLWRVAVSCFRPCAGSVRRVAYVHEWEFGPSCWVRLWLFQLGGCARRFPAARGVRGGGGWGVAGVFLWGWGCPVFPCPCGAGLVLAGLTFLWPVAVCVGGPLRAGGWGLCSVLPFPCPAPSLGGGGVVPSAVWWSPSFGPCGSEGWAVSQCVVGYCVVVLRASGRVSFLFGARRGLIGLGRRLAFLALLRYGVLWCAVPRCAVLCCVVRCCALPCRAVPCRAVPFSCLAALRCAVM